MPPVSGIRASLWTNPGRKRPRPLRGGGPAGPRGAAALDRIADTAFARRGRTASPERNAAGSSGSQLALARCNVLLKAIATLQRQADTLGARLVEKPFATHLEPIGTAATLLPGAGDHAGGTALTHRQLRPAGHGRVCQRPGALHFPDRYRLQPLADL